VKRLPFSVSSSGASATMTDLVETFLFRVDLYISLKDRNGVVVPHEKLYQIRNEIVDRFGGITMTPIVGNPVYDGFWQSPVTRKLAKDKNSIFSVLIPQTDEAIEFFIKKKDTWKELLNFEELLITVHQLQVL